MMFVLGFPFSRPVSQVRVLQQACLVPDGEPRTVSLAPSSASLGQSPQASHSRWALGCLPWAEPFPHTGVARFPVPSLPCWQACS